MKTPWSSLLQYGTAIATLIVMSIAGIIFLAVVGVAILITKVLEVIQ